MSVLAALGRVALGAPFMYLGYQAVKTPGGRVAMATKFGVPAEYAETAVRANGAVMVLGGAAVAPDSVPGWVRWPWRVPLCRRRWPAMRSGTSPTRRPRRRTSRSF